MATLHIENLPDDLYAQLRQLAASHNRPIDAQVITLLEIALQTNSAQLQGETPNKFVINILEESRRRRKLLPTDLGLPDSTTLIREDRDR